MTYQEEFIVFMVRSGVLTFGDFTTKSGRKTPYFINTGNYKTGAQADALGSHVFTDCYVDVHWGFLRCSSTQIIPYDKVICIGLVRKGNSATNITSAM